MSDASSGYPIEQCIDEVGFKISEFQCSICLSLCKDPTQCPKGHLYCLICIESAIAIKQKCPVCSTILSKDNLSFNLIAKNIISTVTIRCTASPIIDGDKCPWTGRIADLERHLHNCEYQMIKCSSKGCDIKIMQRELLSHLSICPHSLVRCDHCDIDVMRRNLAAHMESCSCRPVSCPNKGCQDIIRFNDLNCHRLMTCMYENVPCPLKLEGFCGSHCPNILLRRELESHLSAPATVSAMIRGTLNIKKRFHAEIESLLNENKKIKLQVAEDRVIDTMYRHRLNPKFVNAGGWDIIDRWMRLTEEKRDQSSAEFLSKIFKKQTDSKDPVCYIAFEWDPMVAAQKVQVWSSRVYFDLDKHLKASAKLSAKRNESDEIGIYLKVFDFDGELDLCITLLRIGRGEPLSRSAKATWTRKIDVNEEVVLSSGDGYGWPKFGSHTLNSLVEEGYIQPDIGNKLLCVCTFSFVEHIL